MASKLIYTLWVSLPIWTSTYDYVDTISFEALLSSPLLPCFPTLQMWGIPTQIKNVTQWLCIECPLCGRRNEIFNKISGESYLFIYFFHKKMSTQLHPHRHTHSLRVISLHPGIVTNGRKSHLLLQAVTITEKIYCRKLVNSISAGGPEMIYQRFRDLRQHFTSFIQMLWANKIMIKPLATFVSCAFWQDYC